LKTKLKILPALLLLTFAINAQVKQPSAPMVMVPYSKSLQAVVVTTADWPTVQGTARRFERISPTAKWQPVGEAFPVVVGRNGLAWSPDSPVGGSVPNKREGDGKSPAGMFPLTFAFGTSLKPEGVSVPYTKLAEFTECVDDVKSSHYNTIVDRTHVGNFDWKSSEKMLAVGEPYELGVFVGYNSFPVTPGNGSCIFLHIWKNASTGTAGCTAMQRSNLEKLVAWLDPAKNPYLIQMPEAAYNKHRKPWNLPRL